MSSSWIKILLCPMTAFALMVGCQKAPNAPVAPAGAVEERQGGVDGGGGDFPQSSDGQVQDAIKSAQSTYLEDLFYNLALSRSTITDPHILRVIESFYNDEVGSAHWYENQPIAKDFAATKFDLKSKGGCVEKEGRSHAMGVEHFQLQAPICVSLEQLKSIPPEDLTVHVTALFAHEFVHHFGFGELEATKFQNYVVHNFKTVASYPETIKVYLPAIEFSTQNPYGEYANSEILLQRGKVVDRSSLDSTANYCALYVAYDGDIHQEIAKIKKPLVMTAGGSEIHLQSISSGASCSWDHGVRAKDCGLTHVEFEVNRAWTGTGWDPTGAPVYRKEGPFSRSKIVRISCQGKQMRYQDILRIFNPNGEAR